jgi:hypothetical protein
MGGLLAFAGGVQVKAQVKIPHISKASPGKALCPDQGGSGKVTSKHGQGVERPLRQEELRTNQGGPVE